MGIYVKGILENIAYRKNKDGETFLRVYQVGQESAGGLKSFTNIEDFDLKRKVEVGKEIELPVYCVIRIPEKKDGTKLAPVLEYKALKEDEAKLLPPKVNKAA